MSAKERSAMSGKQIAPPPDHLRSIACSDTGADSGGPVQQARPVAWLSGRRPSGVACALAVPTPSTLQASTRSADGVLEGRRTVPSQPVPPAPGPAETAKGA
jgi:hypothetical protein